MSSRSRRRLDLTKICTMFMLVSKVLMGACICVYWLYGRHYMGNYLLKRKNSALRWLRLPTTGQRAAQQQCPLFPKLCSMNILAQSCVSKEMSLYKWPLKVLVRICAQWRDASPSVFPNPSPISSGLSYPSSQKTKPSRPPGISSRCLRPAGCAECFYHSYLRCICY